jgi:hypothetical protein
MRELQTVPTNPLATNQAIALRLQFKRPVGSSRSTRADHRALPKSSFSLGVTTRARNADAHARRCANAHQAGHPAAISGLRKSRSAALSLPSRAAPQRINP